jgi:hypothetical protein
VTGEGRRLIKKDAVRKASPQNFNGIEAEASNERLVSTRWRCFRSTEPCC